MLDAKTEERVEESLIKWQCPPNPYIKINFDGSVSNSVAAGGFVARNGNCKPVLAGVMNFGSVSINVAEALALREALLWARRRNWIHVWVEGGACEVPWNLEPIIEDIRWCAKSFQDIRWSHIFREINFVADAANIGLKSSNLCIWDACLPMEALLAFRFDCNGFGCVRGFFI